MRTADVATVGAGAAGALVAGLLLQANLVLVLGAAVAVGLVVVLAERSRQQD